MDFDDDLSIFLQDFGIDARVAGKVVRGIFNNAYTESLDGRIAGLLPQFTCRSVDVSAVIDGTSVVVGKNTYLVRGIESDGTGVSLLRLEIQ